MRCPALEFRNLTGQPEQPTSPARKLDIKHSNMYPIHSDVERSIPSVRTLNGVSGTYSMLPGSDCNSCPPRFPRTTPMSITIIVAHRHKFIVRQGPLSTRVHASGKCSRLGS